MFLKLEKYLFYFFLFAIPFQTRKIFWYDSWRFNEWTSISIYGTDLLLIILFVFWFIHSRQQITNHKSQITNKSQFSKSQFQNPNFYLIAFWAISGISILNSSSYLISSFQWLKLTEFIIFYWYLSNYAIYKFGFTNTLFPIFFGGLFQAIIAIAQFLKQENLGLRYLGESIFNKDLLGVASFYLPAQAGLPSGEAGLQTGEKILRAYGTAPHPNVLAAYLFLAIFTFYFIWFYKRSTPPLKSENYHNVIGSHFSRAGSKYDNWLLAAHLITLWGFFLTFSRVAFFLLGLNFLIRSCLLFFKYKKFGGERRWKLIICTGMVIVLFAALYWPELMTRLRISGEEDAVQIRNFYNRESLQWLSLTGIGIGNFVNELAAKMPMLPNYMYQPVHNIYLLIYSETGVLGISAFILFLVFLVRDFVIRTKMERIHHYSLMLVLSSFLFMGFFDHLLWTLQQGRFIFWLVLASIAVNESDDIV